MRTSGVATAVRLSGGALFAIALGWGFFAYLTTFAIVPGPWPGSRGLARAAFDAALFTGFALHHSLFARTRIKQLISTLVSPDLERSFYVIVASLLFMVVLIVWRPIPGMAWHATGAIAWCLAALQVTGLLFTGHAASRLGVMELAGLRSPPRSPPPASALPTTNRSPIASDATTAPALVLKDTGVYGLVRHPIYLAWLLMVWPAPVMTGSRLCFAAITTIYLVVAIPLEERTLVRDFGQAYVSYQKKVRWRMVPGVY